MDIKRIGEYMKIGLLVLIMMIFATQFYLHMV